MNQNKNESCIHYIGIIAYHRTKKAEIRDLVLLKSSSLLDLDLLLLYRLINSLFDVPSELQKTISQSEVKKYIKSRDHADSM